MGTLTSQQVQQKESNNSTRQQKKQEASNNQSQKFKRQQENKEIISKIIKNNHKKNNLKGDHILANRGYVKANYKPLKNESIQQNIVYIYTKKNGKLLFRGTGFRTYGNTIITAAHNFPKNFSPQDYMIYFPVFEGKQAKKMDEQSVKSNPNFFKIIDYYINAVYLKTRDEKYDYAFLKIEIKNEKFLFKSADDNKVILVNSQDYLTTNQSTAQDWIQGQISFQSLIISYYEDELCQSQGITHYHDKKGSSRLYQYDQATESGSSGGPNIVKNSEGQMVIAGIHINSNMILQQNYSLPFTNIFKINLQGFQKQYYEKNLDNQHCSKFYKEYFQKDTFKKGFVFKAISQIKEIKIQRRLNVYLKNLKAKYNENIKGKSTLKNQKVQPQEIQRKSSGKQQEIPQQQENELKIQAIQEQLQENKRKSSRKQQEIPQQQENKLKNQTIQEQSYKIQRKSSGKKYNILHQKEKSSFLLKIGLISHKIFIKLIQIERYHLYPQNLSVQDILVQDRQDKINIDFYDLDLYINLFFQKKYLRHNKSILLFNKIIKTIWSNIKDQIITEKELQSFVQGRYLLFLFENLQDYKFDFKKNKMPQEKHIEPKEDIYLQMRDIQYIMESKFTVGDKKIQQLNQVNKDIKLQDDSQKVKNAVQKFLCGKDVVIKKKEYRQFLDYFPIWVQKQERQYRAIRIIKMVNYSKNQPYQSYFLRFYITMVVQAIKNVKRFIYNYQKMVEWIIGNYKELINQNQYKQLNKLIKYNKKYIKDQLKSYFKFNSQQKKQQKTQIKTQKKIQKQAQQKTQKADLQQWFSFQLKEYRDKFENKDEKQYQIENLQKIKKVTEQLNFQGQFQQNCYKRKLLKQLVVYQIIFVQYLLNLINKKYQQVHIRFELKKIFYFYKQIIQRKKKKNRQSNKIPDPSKILQGLDNKGVTSFLLQSSVKFDHLDHDLIQTYKSYNIKCKKQEKIRLQLFQKLKINENEYQPQLTELKQDQNDYFYSRFKNYIKYIVKIFKGETIYNAEKSIASGILIQQSYILTSAHSIQNLDLQNIKIWINFGEYKDKLLKIKNYYPRSNLEHLNQGPYQDFIFLQLQQPLKQGQGNNQIILLDYSLASKIESHKNIHAISIGYCHNQSGKMALMKGSGLISYQNQSYAYYVNGKQRFSGAPIISWIKTQDKQRKLDNLSPVIMGVFRGQKNDKNIYAKFMQDFLYEQSDKQFKAKIKKNCYSITQYSQFEDLYINHITQVFDGNIELFVINIMAQIVKLNKHQIFFKEMSVSNFEVDSKDHYQFIFNGAKIVNAIYQHDQAELIKHKKQNYQVFLNLVLELQKKIGKPIQTLSEKIKNEAEKFKDNKDAEFNSLEQLAQWVDKTYQLQSTKLKRRQIYKQDILNKQKVQSLETKHFHKDVLERLLNLKHATYKLKSKDKDVIHEIKIVNIANTNNKYKAYLQDFITIFQKIKQIMLKNEIQIANMANIQKKQAQKEKSQDLIKRFKEMRKKLQNKDEFAWILSLFQQGYKKLIQKIPSVTSYNGELGQQSQKEQILSFLSHYQHQIQHKKDKQQVRILIQNSTKRMKISQNHQKDFKKFQIDQMFQVDYYNKAKNYFFLHKILMYFASLEWLYQIQPPPQADSEDNQLFDSEDNQFLQMLMKNMQIEQ